MVAGYQTSTRTTENGQPETAPPKYQYVWSARYIDSPVLRDLNSDEDGLCDDERLYYLGDANFNVTTLVDTNGAAVERYLYDPYGKVTIYTGDWSSTRSSSSYDNVYLYTGRERDEETGYYNYRNRYYHAQLGRFLSRDPIGYDGGDANLYRYVGKGPTTRLDSEGTCGQPINTARARSDIAVWKWIAQTGSQGGGVAEIVAAPSSTIHCGSGAFFNRPDPFLKRGRRASGSTSI